MSCLKGHKLLPTLQHANIWAFVGFNCLTIGRQPLKHRVLAAILDRELAAPPRQAETCCRTDFSATEVSHSGFWGDTALPRQQHCLPLHLHPPAARHAAPLPCLHQQHQEVSGSLRELFFLHEKKNRVFFLSSVCFSAGSVHGSESQCGCATGGASAVTGAGREEAKGGLGLDPALSPLRYDYCLGYNMVSTPKRPVAKQLFVKHFSTYLPRWCSFPPCAWKSLLKLSADGIFFSLPENLEHY